MHLILEVSTSSTVFDAFMFAATYPHLHHVCNYPSPNIYYHRTLMASLKIAHNKGEQAGTWIL